MHAVLSGLFADRYQHDDGGPKEHQPKKTITKQSGKTAKEKGETTILAGENRTIS